MKPSSILDSDWLECAHQHRCLVAVSGGRDSVALLHACIHAGLTDLVICHINHHLRGSDSDADEALVTQLAEQFALPISTHHINVANLAKTSKKSIELAAREARHHAFYEACQQHQCHAVLLAHHADDQAETTLFNLLRGSAGLKGMLPISHLSTPALTLHRPLLKTRRSEINAYILQHNIRYREDSTNAEPFATRNRIRNEALPLLQDILGRDVIPAILSALQSSQQNEAFIEQMIDYPSMLDPQGRIHLPSLRAAPPLLQQKILHRYLTENKISNIDQSLINRCLQILDTKNPAKINLPGSCYLRRKEQRLFIHKP